MACKHIPFSNSRRIIPGMPIKIHLRGLAALKFTFSPPVFRKQILLTNTQIYRIIGKCKAGNSEGMKMVHYPCLLLFYGGGSVLQNIQQFTARNRSSAAQQRDVQFYLCNPGYIGICYAALALSVYNPLEHPSLAAVRRASAFRFPVCNTVKSSVALPIYSSACPPFSSSF